MPNGLAVARLHLPLPSTRKAVAKYLRKPLNKATKQRNPKLPRVQDIFLAVGTKRQAASMRGISIRLS